MNGIIYMLTNKKNGKVYIGQTTVSLRLRINQHFSKRNKCVLLAKAIEKYGRKNFKIEILEKHDNKDDLDNAEKNWIAFYHATERECGYNIAEGGHNGKPGLGKHMGEEQKKTIGKKNSVHMKRLWNDPKYREQQLKSHIGKSCRGTGFHLIEETKQKLREINLGEKYGEETKRKHSEAMKGRKLTPEHIEKTRAAQKGRKVSEENKAKLREAWKRRKEKLGPSGGLTGIPHKGHETAPETRRKISEALRRRNAIIA
jgi:group I intron endonuclease